MPRIFGSSSWVLSLSIIRSLVNYTRVRPLHSSNWDIKQHCQGHWKNAASILRLRAKHQNISVLSYARWKGYYWHSDPFFEWDLEFPSNFQICMSQNCCICQEFSYFTLPSKRVCTAIYFQTRLFGLHAYKVG